MGTFKTLDDLGDLTGKVALVRVDLNVPMKNGKVTDATRIERAAPTIKELAAKGAKVIVLSHFGRPKGARHSTMSTSMVQGDLERFLARLVPDLPQFASFDTAFHATNPEAAVRAFTRAAEIYRTLPGGQVHGAHVDMQLAAVALSNGQPGQAVQFADRAIPVVRQSQKTPPCRGATWMAWHW